MRAPSHRELPPPLEMLCLNALWAMGSGNVARVRASVGEGGKALAYTTVMTLLDRLVKRGLVTRGKQGRSFVYTPSASRETIRRAALTEFVERFFGGSAAELRAFLDEPGESAEKKAAAAAASAAPSNESAPPIDPTLL